MVIVDGSHTTATGGLENTETAGGPGAAFVLATGDRG